MARDKNEKVWIGGGVVAALALAGIAWSFVVGPQFDDVSSLHSQTADAQTQNLTLQSNVSKLQQQYAHIADVRKQLASAQEQLPADTGMAALTQQINAQAQAHHVTVTQVVATAPTAVVASPAAAAAAPAAASSSAAPAAAATPAATGIYSIGLTLGVTGSQTNDLAFAHAVQYQGPRAALVTSMTMQNGAAGTTGTGSGTSGTTMSLIMQVYVDPPAAASAPTAPPGGVAPTPSPTSTP